jgi:molybdenum cofactor guanylyltransferase
MAERVNISGPIAGVLLAGGQARRLGGGGKALLTLAGKPLLLHAIERLRVQTDALVINANGDPARFAGFGLPVMADTIGGFPGPLAGVLAGMRWAMAALPAAQWIVTAACDTPFFPADLAAALTAASHQHGGTIALASSGGREHPVFGLWPVALADDLEAALASGQRRVLGWAQAQGAVVTEFPFIACGGTSIDPFININTPEDLQQAEHIAGRLIKSHINRLF